jgi:hypothetical protein
MFICFSLAALFAYAFYIRYWKWRDCIALVESSCTEADAANATGSGMIWAIPAIGFLIWGLILSARTIARLKQYRHNSP